MDPIENLNQEQIQNLIQKLQSKLHSHLHISPSPNPQLKHPTILPVENNIDWSLTAFGLIIAYKPPPFSVFQQELTHQWELDFPCSFHLKGHNLFEIKFHSIEDRFKVCSNTPWQVAGYYVNIRPSFPTANIHYLDLYTIPLWIGVFDLPFSYESGENAAIAAMPLGDVVLREANPKLLGIEPYFRVKVMVDVRKPRTFKSIVEIPNQESFKIRFKYENLATHCIFCGVLGHRSERCITKATKGFDHHKEAYIDPYEENRYPIKEVRLMSQAQFHQRQATKINNLQARVANLQYALQDRFNYHPIQQEPPICDHDIILDGPCGCEKAAQFAKKMAGKRVDQHRNEKQTLYSLFGDSSFTPPVYNSHQIGTSNLNQHDQKPVDGPPGFEKIKKEMKVEVDSGKEVEFSEDESTTLTLDIAANSFEKKRKQEMPTVAISRKRKMKDEAGPNSQEGPIDGWWDIFKSTMDPNERI